MIKKYSYKNITWIDLENPTNEEVQEVARTYGLYPSVAQELLLPTLKPRVDLYKNFIYLILHFPAIKHTHNGNASQEIDFVISKDFIITTRYDTVDSLVNFGKIFETNTILQRNDFGDHAGYIFCQMATSLYKSLLDELEYIRDELKGIEEHIFNGKEREMVRDLSKVSRSLLMFNHATSTHREVLDSFDAAAKKFFGEDFNFPLHEIANEYAKVEHSVEISMDSMHELRETNNSLLSTKQNEIMKVLTMMSFVMLPLSFIASLYSMNTQDIPLVSVENSFWLIFGIMVAIGLVVILVFKRKRWF